MKRWASLLLLCGLCRNAIAEQAASQDTSLPEQKPVGKEPSWGRLYLRNGLAPIQYFRDSFGGEMVSREVEFVFPQREEDQLGCSTLSEPDQQAITEANGSVVLVVDRGECTFETKARVAQAAGASGLVVVSTSDDVHGPGAALESDAEPITIPSVMIRQSGGVVLRSAAQYEQLRGWLMPMVCQLHPYKCEPRSEDEKKFIATATGRSGRILTQGADGSFELGPFLSSAFGSVFPTSTALDLAVVSAPQQACSVPVERDTALEGKAALITISTEHCSVFEQISMAQLAGARVAFVVKSENETLMTPPAVLEDWIAYNISIPSAIVSSNTATNLKRFAGGSAEHRTIHFSIDNSVAREWEQLRKLGIRTAWPVRKERRDKLARKLVSELGVMTGSDRHIAIEALEHQFMTVASGTPERWQAIMSAPATGQVTDRVGAGTLEGKASHEEL